jgi:two-component system, OmpR family, sensor kinase
MTVTTRSQSVTVPRPGEPIVMASAVSETKAGTWLDLSVQDGGPGIPPEAQERIFERLSRLESSQGTQGSGLGLSIVSAIAEAHGGTVRLSGVQGQGSTFTIRIPFTTPNTTGATPSQQTRRQK